MKIGILGAGAWGSALALSAAAAGHDITLWSYNNKFDDFHGAIIPSNITMTDDIAQLADTALWMIVVPAAFFRETLRRAAPYFDNQSILICTKGIEVPSNKLMAEVLADELPHAHDIAVLSGPQFAAEVARHVPTSSTLAGTARARRDGAAALPAMFMQETDDILGAEICGAGKNAVALICGYMSIAAAGENERAAVLTRAWGEVADYGVACGAELRTFLGLCGVGDLFLSATSVTSRNFSAGRVIASGGAPTGTVEGMCALRGLIQRMDTAGVQAPLLREMAKKMKLAD